MSDQGHVLLNGSAREPLPDARRVAAVDPGTVIRATLILRRDPGGPGDSGVRELALKPAAERARTSRAAIEQTMGASNDDMQLVRDFARDRALRVVEESAPRRTIVLEGSVSAFAAVFHVQLATYEHGEDTYRGREGPLEIPAALAGVVEAVIGLDDRPQARPHFRMQEGVIAAHVAHAYTPLDVGQLYGFPAGLDGSGQCIAIIELGGGYTAADLQTYFTGLGIATPTVVSVSVDGATNSPVGQPNSADGEVLLDIEVAGALAPGARIAVYFAPNTDQGFLDAITTAVHDSTNRPSVVSISWGLYESGWTGQSLNAYDQAFADAAALGVTVLCASGDGGSNDGAPDGLDHVDFPASSPHVVACGGTRLESTGMTITDEEAWTSSGGGISSFFALPPYQAGANVPVSTNPAGRIGRGVPDIAGDADPATGYQVRVDNQNVVFGGTSAVAPLYAALVARVNQALDTQGLPSIGLLNTAIYAHGNVVRDMTMGNNGGYVVGHGYDAVTGLGCLVGDQLLTAMGAGGGGGEMQLVWALWDGRLDHTIRRADGSWQAFGDVAGQAGNVGAAMAVANAMVAGEQQLAMIGSDGRLWHTIRHATGTWDQFDDADAQTGNAGPHRRVSTAGSSGELQLCVVGADGRVRHTIRHVTGAWDRFGDVAGQTGDPGPVIDVAVAGTPTRTHVIVVAATGRLLHTIRLANGTWEPLGDVAGQAGDHSPIKGATADAIGDELHVVALTGSGHLWHTIRHANGTWDQFGDVAGQTGDAGPVVDVTATGITGELQVTVLTADGHLWHAIRHADGSWDKFGDVDRQAGDPGAVQSIAAAH